MNTFEVTFFWEGHRYTEVVTTSSSSSARNMIRSKFPGASIMRVHRV